MFTGDVNEDAATLTSYILSLQHEHVPHRVYTTKPGDPPWFGYRCRLPADAKHKALKTPPHSEEQEPPQAGLQRYEEDQ